MPQREFYPGVWANADAFQISVELELVKCGGSYKNKTLNKMVGNGMEFHFKKALSLLWPDMVWHRWNELFVKEWLTHKHVGILGPTNASKSHTAAICHLLCYYADPHHTTVIVCSNTKESLENRIWGEMKKLHRDATTRYRWLPGNLIEGKLRIVSDARSEAEEGRDFRNGLMGVAAYVGGTMRGISSLVGIKNKHLFICGDELQTLPKSFLDSLANLMKSTEKGGTRRCTGMGNPSDTIDSLGLLCEPAAYLGGWDSGIDQTPRTKTWATRWPDGICIQFCGSDSPNMEVPVDAEPPYPFLITKKDMEDDASKWGIDDWHYTMFNEGRMPRGQGSRRVLTRSLCEKGRAKDEALWLNSNRTYIAFLDAAYTSGGDRCVFGILRFGSESMPLDPQNVLSNMINQDTAPEKRNTILELVKTMIIPINSGVGEMPEDTIVAFVQRECEEAHIPPENFYYDSGMKTALVQAFSRIWSPKVNSVDCGGVPSEDMVSANIPVKCKDYYSKKITEIWYSVRLTVEAGQFRGMTESVMLEFCSREFTKVGNNKTEVESKVEMKKKTGKSPDEADAVAIGVWGARQKGFVIRNLALLHKQRPVRQLWKRELRDRALQLRDKGQLDHSV